MALAGGRSKVTTRTPSSTSVRTGSLMTGPPPPREGCAPPPSGTQRPEHRPGDDVPLDLAGAVPDALDACVPPESLDRKLAHQPHATEDLHGPVGDAPEGLG